MRWDREKRINDQDDAYEIPKNWLLIHYYEALNILFRIENALRIFVYSILKNELFDKWGDIHITNDDGNETTLQALAKKRISQIQDFGYLGYEIKCPIMHLTSGELSHIITHKTYWSYFNDYFKARKEVIENKLDEIGSVRNALAHFRVIKPEDVEVVKSNSLHLFLSIKEYINSLISYGRLVPSNSQLAWYLKLQTLEFKYGKLLFYESTDKKWIKIYLIYKCQIIEVKEVAPGYLRYKILNLESANILKSYAVLTKYITYLSEEIPFISKRGGSEPNFKKKLTFTIKETCLANNYEEIHAEYYELFTKIAEEIDMINKDHYAEGTIVKSCDVYYLRDTDKNRWNGNTDSMICKVKEDDPIEYWGEFTSGHGEFIISTHRYPWFPTDISKEESPF